METVQRDIHFPGLPRIISRPEEIPAALKQLLMHPVVGISTQRRPGTIPGEWYPVSLLAIATLDHVFMFRLHQCGLSSDLALFLGHKDILKVGWNIRFEFKSLQNLNYFPPRSLRDMDALFAPYTKEQLIQEVFGKRAPKTCWASNWEQTNLSSDQIRYAATDAWLALKLYTKSYEK